MPCDAKRDDLSEARGGAGGMSTSPPFLCVYASQVAACIGAHRHQKVTDAVELMWRRLDEPGFLAALERHGVKTEEQVAHDLMGAHPAIRQLVATSLTASCDTSGQVAQRYEAAARDLDGQGLSTADRKVVDSVVRHNLYTAYGNDQESNALAYVRQVLGIRCREDPTFYKRQQGVCAGPDGGEIPWYVGGKVDAVDEGRQLVIELKNRVNRLFYRVPEYERVQVQAYMQLLDVDRALLVECLKPPPEPDRAPEFVANVTPIQRDRQFWEQSVVPKLQAFLDFVVRLVHDPALQDAYLKSSRRAAFVALHV